MDYGNTKTPSMRRRWGGATLSQLSLPRRSNPNSDGRNPNGTIQLQNEFLEKEKEKITSDMTSPSTYYLLNWASTLTWGQLITGINQTGPFLAHVFVQPDLIAVGKCFRLQCKLHNSERMPAVLMAVLTYFVGRPLTAWCWHCWPGWSESVTRFKSIPLVCVTLEVSANGKWLVGFGMRPSFENR